MRRAAQDDETNGSPTVAYTIVAVSGVFGNSNYGLLH